MTNACLRCRAPAKINFFLHILNRNSNGYHQLHTAFQCIDWFDELEFRLRQDSQIQFEGPLFAGKNLVIEAALALQELVPEKKAQGVCIRLHKSIANGAGLGGGSSDAATTLIALNTLWNLNVSTIELNTIGLKLGADVPFFLQTQPAIAGGIGEILSPIQLPSIPLLVVVPPVHVSTEIIFQHKDLPRKRSIPENYPACLDQDYADLFPKNSGYSNDCEKLVRNLYSEIDFLFHQLTEFKTPRLSGTGGSVFILFDSLAEQQDAKQQLSSQSWTHAGSGFHLHWGKTLISNTNTEIN
ncbi:MAG: 4-(cytidine 5'-diphospho)-2-C-methyl-D-erythritol kinase [Pseudomonadota bacterium]